MRLDLNAPLLPKKIPIVPGVQATTGGIFNASIRDLICRALFGGLGDLFKGNLVCIEANLSEILNDQGLPGIPDLKTELEKLRQEILHLQEHMGIPQTIQRINEGIADVQKLLALDGFCPVPVVAPPIPNVLAQLTNSYFGVGQDILNQLGALTSPKVCLDANGNINTGAWNPDSILNGIRTSLNNAGGILPGTVANFSNRIASVQSALSASINRELFPDFRHKDSILGGGVGTAAGLTGITLAARPPDDAIAALTGVPEFIYEVDANGNLVKVPNPEFAARLAQLQSEYPLASQPNLDDAINQAHLIAASVCSSASYSITGPDGILRENIWMDILGPEAYSLALAACESQDTFHSEGRDVIDYCGRIIGQTQVVLSQADNEPLDGTIEADEEPLNLFLNFSWIDGTAEDPTRLGWGIEGFQSMQAIGLENIKKKVLALDLNPDIVLQSGRVYNLTLPPSNPNPVTGFKRSDHGGEQVSLNLPTGQEFYLYEVEEVTEGGRLAIDGKRYKPNTAAKFNLGLYRIETSEYLEDANGRDENDPNYSWTGLGYSGTEPTETVTYVAAQDGIEDNEQTRITFPADFPILDEAGNPVLIPIWKRSFSTLQSGSTLQLQVEKMSNIVYDEEGIAREADVEQWPSTLCYSDKDGNNFGLIYIKQQQDERFIED
jgi:hypothetical protein